MKTRRVITALLLILFSVPLAHSEDDELLKILAPVHEKHRSRLAERLGLFIEYQRTQQWDKLFKLIDKGNAGNKSIEVFAKEMTEMGHLDFVPQRAGAEVLGPQYRIYGCVKARTDGGIIWFQGGLVAYLQEGDWYFTPHFLIYDRSGRPLPCTNKPQSGIGR